MPPFRTNIRVYRYKRPPHPCSAQDLLNDDDLTHLKLEEKCCKNGCLIITTIGSDKLLRYPDVNLNDPPKHGAKVSVSHAPELKYQEKVQCL